MIKLVALNGIIPKEIVLNDNQEVVIGRVKGDIIISQRVISSTHAKIVLKNNILYVMDLNSTNGTYINGIKIEPNKYTQLKNNDKVSFGVNEITFLVTTNSNQTKILTSKDYYTIGRDNNNDIVINYNLISSKHLKIYKQNNEWYIQDLNSSNGTFLNNLQNRILTAKLLPNQILYLANFKISTNKLLEFINKKAQKKITENLELTKEKLTIGRNPNSDLFIKNPNVSFNHAIIYKNGNDYEIEDLNSTNGTYLNGEKIQKATIRNGDEISIAGVYNFKIEFHKNLTKIKKEFVDGFSLEARNITIQTKSGVVLLDDISFTIYPGELVGLMGLSGAGKTTLLKALNGYDKPAKGSSYIAGNDLYKNFNLLKTIIGYVPQDDIVHAELTVMEALRYYARERLATDISNKELDELILDTLEKLGLKGTENTIIGSPDTVKGISGGQRKRLNLAMELLADPKIIFLDEPTSGLSAVDTKMVMELLRKLADEGRTIIITIHQPSLDVYKLMDNVIILSYGKLAYYGPTYPNSIQFFNHQKGNEILNNPDNALIGLYEGEKRVGENEISPNERDKKGIYWQNIYKQSKEYKEFVKERKSEERHLEFDAKSVSMLKQLQVLTSRYLKIKLKDFTNTFILLIQAPLIAFMISILFPKELYEQMPVTLHFVLAISAIWFGTINASREIVAEKAIFERERMIGMKILPYVLSKFIVLTLLCVIQSIMLVGIVEVMIGLGFKDDFWQLFLLVFLTSLSGLSIGLLISTIAKSQAQALALVPIVLLPMIIFGGGMISVKQMKDNDNPISYMIAQVTPTRWVLEEIVNLYENNQNSEIYCKNQVHKKDFWKNFDKKFFDKYGNNINKTCKDYSEFVNNKMDIKEKQKLIVKKNSCENAMKDSIRKCKDSREFIANYYGKAAIKSSKTIYFILSLFILIPFIITILVLKSRDKVR